MAWSGDRFEIVLTTANRYAPSANDVAPTRYNFYGSAKNLDNLRDLILHEIGTNLMTRDREEIAADGAVRKQTEEAGLKSDPVIWRAFESLAEFYKARLFQMRRAEWSGPGFDGEPFHFPVFFEIYEREYASDPSQSAAQMMRKGVAGFVAWKVKQLEK